MTARILPAREQLQWERENGIECESPEAQADWQLVARYAALNDRLHAEEPERDGPYECSPV